MFKISRKFVLGMAIIGLFSMIGCKGYAEPVNTETINSAFQDAMNETLSSKELNMFELSEDQAKKIILPSAAKIIAKTIKLVREKTGEDISAQDVFGALPPKLEKTLNTNKEAIMSQVADIK